MTLPNIQLVLAGLCTSTIEVSPQISVSELCSRIQGLAGCAGALKLLSKGCVLTRTPESPLQALGLGDKSKVIVMRGPVEVDSTSLKNDGVDAEEHVEKVLRTVEAMCKRHQTSTRHTVALEDQNGNPLHMSETQRRFITAAMALAEQGRQEMTRGRFDIALDLLQAGEQAFQATDTSVLGKIDNVGLLLLDLVWCSYMLQDTERLTVSAQRLKRAREELDGAYGAGLTRLRTLNGGFSPESATYLRLELLDGICHLYNGHAREALDRLRRADAYLKRLSVDDVAMASLMNMGFSQKDATRALRFCANDVNQAVDFCMRQETEAQQRRERSAQDAARHRRQRKYGQTNNGSWMNITHLDNLEALGYPKLVAAEALRRTDNDFDAALTALSDDVEREGLEVAAVTRSAEAQQRRRPARPRPAEPGDTGPSDVDADSVAALVDAGYVKYYARWALKKCSGDLEHAHRALEAWGSRARNQARASAAPDTIEGDAGATAPESGADAAAAANTSQTSAARDAESQGDADGDGESEGEEAMLEEEEALEDEEEIDAEAEQELVSTLWQASEDPLAIYDVDVSLEASALKEFLAAAEARLSETASAGST